MTSRCTTGLATVQKYNIDSWMDILIEDKKRNSSYPMLKNRLISAILFFIKEGKNIYFIFHFVAFPVLSTWSNLIRAKLFQYLKMSLNFFYDFWQRYINFKSNMQQILKDV